MMRSSNEGRFFYPEFDCNCDYECDISSDWITIRTGEKPWISPPLFWPASRWFCWDMLPGRAAYLLLFFNIWEARVLCSHCPYWARDGRILRCHANMGVLKIWKYRPGPMSLSEKVQFFIGAGIFLAFPLILMIIGKAFVWCGVALAGSISGIFLLKTNFCSRCVNFACPLNGVPEDIRIPFRNQVDRLKQ